jgi:hypothetical protein
MGGGPSSTTASGFRGTGDCFAASGRAGSRPPPLQRQTVLSQDDLTHLAPALADELWQFILDSNRTR